MYSNIFRYEYSFVSYLCHFDVEIGWGGGTGPTFIPAPVAQSVKVVVPTLCSQVQDSEVTLLFFPLSDRKQKKNNHTWRLLGDYLETTWRTIGDHMETTWKLLRDYLETTWRPL